MLFAQSVEGRLANSWIGGARSYFVVGLCFRLSTIIVKARFRTAIALSEFPCCKYTFPRFVRTAVSEGSTAAALSPTEAARVRSLAAASVAAIARRA
jgi:hypothetical protein